MFLVQQERSSKANIPQIFIVFLVERNEFDE